MILGLVLGTLKALICNFPLIYFLITSLLISRKVADIFCVDSISSYFAESICRVFSFLVESLLSFKQRTELSASRDGLTSSSVCTHFSLPSCCTETLSTSQSKSGDSELPCLVPGFPGSDLSFVPFRVRMAIGLSNASFIILVRVPSVSSFPWALCVALCQRPSLCQLIGSCGFCSHVALQVLMCEHGPSLRPWKRANLAMIHYLLNVFLNSTCNDFIDNICICIIPSC